MSGRPDAEHHAGAVRSTGGTLAARLAAARQRAFVGRAGELELFRDALTEVPPPLAVLFLHGPGGVGKSALLQRLADEAEAAGWLAARLDCRSAGQPTSFLPSLAGALGLDADADPMPALHAGPPTVLLLDTYEAAPGLDGWLREVFLPDLPSGALVVIAGRDPPVPAWRADPSWHDLLRVIALRNLAPDDARALLAVRRVPPALHGHVLGLTGGHPLALSLLADVVAQTGRMPESHAQAPDVIAALLERFVSEVPTPLHREALHVCAHARLTTQRLLGDVLPGADAAALFDWLRGLSFIEPVPHGICPHDLAREVLDADLRWRDETRYNDLHFRIREHVVRQLRTTRGAEQERAMREAQYLHRHNPLFRPYVTWEDAGATRARSLQAGDVEGVVALAEQFEGPGSAAVVAFWAARQPEAFIVFERPGEPRISGFATFLTLTEPTSDEEAADPLVAALHAWMRGRAPLRAGEHVFVGRHFVFRHAYGQPCPEFDLVQIRSTLRWLNDPGLAWAFVAVPEPLAPFWEPEFSYIDMPRAAGAEATIGDTTWVAFGRDWRASPPDAWLALMAERELALDLDPAGLSTARPATLAVLSQQEFAEAVRDALRNATAPAALAGNPLARSRLVADVRGDGDPGEALADLLAEAVDALRGGEQGDKLHRALATTFFKGAPTQEAAAERLGLPFSTYRRHLAAGIEQITTWLWERELHGAA